jgi:hypothetical protein
MNRNSNSQKPTSEIFGTSQTFQRFLKNLEAHESIVTFESFEFSRLYHEKLQIIFANIRV